MLEKELEIKEEDIQVKGITLKEKLIQLRAKVLNNFTDPQLMLSAFKTESDTNKGYNGRQVLELFQNCDDENSPEVLIKIDKERNIFSISNIGTPFSEKGYNSLFYASLSSKVSGKFIGNKGLGFRSIINWANEINIYSNGICLKYANRYIEEAFRFLYPNERERLQLLKDRSLVESVIPLPLLSYPDITEVELNNGYTTTIEIHYKEGFYNDIVEQVKSITEETLLFLNTIKKVKFEGFENKQNIEITAKKNLPVPTNTVAPSSAITINNKTWNIVEETRQLADVYQNKQSTNKDFYQLKLAYQANLSDNVNKLYSYFLTEEPLEFPFLIHGTFELNQNRKRISNDKNENGVSKNDHILDRLSSLIVNTAIHFSKSNSKASWKPLLFLKHSRSNSALHSFFDALETKVLSNKLFPCVDNNYYKKNDIIYVSESFSTMIQTLYLERYFPNHLIPIGENSHIVSYEINNTVNNITSIVNTISKLELTVKDRALFIYEIVKAFPLIKFNFLIDDAGSVIKADEYIFTPKTKEKDLITPVNTNIQFLNKELYNHLSNFFGYDSTKSLGRSRFVMQKLNSNCNINEYEPNRLAAKIISETNQIIKQTVNSNSITAIKEMNRCLYQNFLQSEAVNFSADISVPTINKNGDIKVCKEVYLSAYYPSGKLTENIFENIYSQDDYIATPESLGINTSDNFDIEKFEEFLIWLQTNKYAKYTTHNLIASGLDDYVNYIKNYNKITTDYRAYQISYRTIVDFDNILNKLTIEKLLLWLSKDIDLENQLYDIEKDKTNVYRAREVKRQYYTTITNKPTFIKFKILSNPKFQFHNHLIEDKTEWLNDIKINYTHPVFINNNISKTRINTSLLLLNAKEDFNDLAIDHISNLFNKLNSFALDKDGKGSQDFYKKVYKHYKKNNFELTKPVKLFAKSNNKLGLYNQEEIYFSDNIKLPENLTDKYPILNYPSRSGGSAAIKLFKINDIKNLNSKLESFNKNDELTTEFNDFFKKLKPFILSFRLENLTTQKSKENDTSKLKNIVIELCNNIECSIEENRFKVDEYEYYYKGNNHYLIAINHTSLANVLSTPKFADVFAEIIGNSFDTSSEKDDFRYLIRNTENYNLHLIEQKFGLQILNEAKTLLGESNDKLNFWKNIYQIKNWNYNDLAKDNYSKALDFFGIESLPVINYADVNNKGNYNVIKDLFHKLRIDVVTYNKNAIEKIDLNTSNYFLLQQAIEKKSALIKTSLWKSLEKSSIENQSQYLTQVNLYEDKNEFITQYAESNRHNFDIDIEKLVGLYTESKYSNLQLFTKDNLYSIRDSNLKNFTSEEQLLIESDLSLKSLIFFESAIDSIKSNLAKQKGTPEEIVLLQETQVNSGENYLTLLDSNNLKTSINRSYKYKGSNSVYVPNISNEKKKKEKGNASEKIVLEYLIKNNFSGIDHTAKFNEGLHYDIRYTNQDGIVKYVEVKTFDNGSFHLSRSEYDFGEKHKENYEIWLVKNKTIIIPIYDFFTNPKYKTTVNEYLVHLEIVNN